MTRFHDGIRTGFMGLTGLAGLAVAGLLAAAPALAAETTRADAGGQAGVSVAQAERTFDFDIPAKPLLAALADYTVSTGVQVVRPGDGAISGRSQPVRGSMTARAAIARMLEGSGLGFLFTAGGTVLVGTPEALANGGATTLPPISVEGRRETAWGPVEGYRATRSATGTKTDTPIMETPASVQVVPRDVIEDQGAQRLQDVYENVSGVYQAGNTLNAQSEVRPIIRGFESPTPLRNGMRATEVGSVDLFNVERVEVLKGPASILYGELEPGGIVNYVTKRPVPIEAYDLEQQIGSYDHFRTTADFTGPIRDDDTMAYRLNLAYTDSGSFRDFVEVERIAAAPSFLWSPRDGTEFMVELAYLREEQPYDTGVPIGFNNEKLVENDTFFNDPDLDGREIKHYTGGYQLRHRFDNVWSVNHQFQLHRAISNNEAIRPRGVRGTVGAEELRLRYQNERRTVDEAQAVADVQADFGAFGAEHKGLAGIELDYQEDERQRYRENLPNILISNDPDVDFTPPADQPLEYQQGHSHRAGFYLQDQLSLLESGRLKLLLGGRYDIYHGEQSNDGVSSPDVDETAFTGRVGTLYQLTPDLGVFASISEGFNPQRLGVVDRGGTPLQPEESIQYETGVKAEFLDKRIAVTASVFRVDKENVAVFDSEYFNDTGETAYFPGVEQRSQGFELDVTGSLTDQIELIGYYSYTDSKVLENEGDPSTVGDRLGNVPYHKARLWATYEFAATSPLSGWSAGGGARYVSENRAQFDTDVILDAYTVFDAAVWYRWERMKAQVNIYNLFDKDYYVRASDQSIVHPGDPFTVMGSLSVDF